MCTLFNSSTNPNYFQQQADSGLGVRAHILLVKKFEFLNLETILEIDCEF
jgi:hypothetical protein